MQGGNAHVNPPRPTTTGDPDAAFAGAVTKLEAEYEIPFQGHTAFAGRTPPPTRRTAR